MKEWICREMSTSTSGNENGVLMMETELIRCKDCKHWKNEDEVFIDEWGIPDGNCIYLHEAQSDDFCSYAERKEA